MNIKMLLDKKKLIISLLVFFIVGFILGFVFLQKQALYSPLSELSVTDKPVVKNEISPLPTNLPSPQSSASLTILPSTKTLKVGETIPVSVTIAGEPAEAVDVVLVYDPKVFSVSNIVDGPAFSKSLMKKLDNGKIIVSRSVDPDKPKLSTSFGEIFSVSFKAIAPVPSSVVDFDMEQTIVAKNGVSILGPTGKGTYTVNP